MFTFKYWTCPPGLSPIVFWVFIKSGLVGVMIILAFGQLLPELLAAQYPLRFMNMRGSCAIVYISQVFDAIGVGHCAWAIYFLSKYLCCSKNKHSEHGNNENQLKNKPVILRVKSAEVLAETSSRSTVGDEESTPQSPFTRKTGSRERTGSIAH